MTARARWHLAGLALMLWVVPAAGRPQAQVRDCPQCPQLLTVTPRPLGRLAITHRFAYGKDKVSYREWKACVVAGSCPALGAAGAATSDPVVEVSWVDVQQYLSWLSLETGVDYRLLSETEWEYLVRRALRPPFAVHGLEWTSDCWHAQLTDGPTDGSSWEVDGDCRYHVARGRRNGDTAPLSTRYRFLFNTSDPALGFRLARTLRE